MQVCQFSASSSLKFLRRRILNIFFFENLPFMSPRQPIKLSDLDKSCIKAVVGGTASPAKARPLFWPNMVLAGPLFWPIMIFLAGSFFSG